MLVEEFNYDKVVRLQNRSVEYPWIMKNRKIGGIGVELGVYKGTSIRTMAKLDPNMKWFGFDSFEGLPEEWDTGRGVIPKGHFARDIPKVPDNVTLTKGWFEDTLPTLPYVFPDTKISILNIDSDLYSSAICGLNILNPLIVPGTLIRFDELLDAERKDKSYPNWEQGEWKALNEWQETFGRKLTAVARSTKTSAIVHVDG